MRFGKIRGKKSKKKPRKKKIDCFLIRDQPAAAPAIPAPTLLDLGNTMPFFVGAIYRSWLPVNRDYRPVYR
jgi:hypothetical protein